MVVVLGIPFRPLAQRQLIFDQLLPHITAAYPYDYVLTADSGHVPFNRAATRNEIVHQAALMGADVVVINDADSLCDPLPLYKAINETVRDHRLHIPFDLVRVSHGGALRRANNVRGLKVYREYGPSCGGIYVIEPSQWIKAGGMDERIIGWGYEDECLLVSANTFLSGPVTHSGVLYNFSHHTAAETEDTIQANIDLRDRYNSATGQPLKLRILQYGANRWTDGSGPHDLYPFERASEEDHELREQLPGY